MGRLGDGPHNSVSFFGCYGAVAVWGVLGKVGSVRGSGEGYEAVGSVRGEWGVSGVSAKWRRQSWVRSQARICRALCMCVCVYGVPSSLTTCSIAANPYGLVFTSSTSSTSPRGAAGEGWTVGADIDSWERQAQGERRRR